MVGVAGGVDLVGVHRQCDEELTGARHPAESFAGTAGCRAVVHGGTSGDGRGRSCPRRVPAGWRGDRMPALRLGCAGRVGLCPCSMGRWVGRVASPAPGSVPELWGDACVAAGHGAVAQSVCGGTDLGCFGWPCRRAGPSPDRRGAFGAGGHGARLVAPGSSAVGRDPGVVAERGGDCRGGRGDPRRVRLSLAGRAGRSRNGHRRDHIPFWRRRAAGRGDAGAGGGGGQWWAAAGAGLAAGGIDGREQHESPLTRIGADR
jgi:hypothetical protein